MKKEKKYYNSLSESNNGVSTHNEFDTKLPVDAMFEHADTLSASDTSRRDFLKFLGFSSVAATLASCEAPVIKSIPYLNKPEEITPGVALYYASSFFVENVFASVLVKTREGRPILLSSNKKLKYGGGINARCQASVLSLYDSNRLKQPLHNGQSSSWESVDNKIKTKLEDCNKQIVLVTPTIISPSVKKIISDFKLRYRNFKVVYYDPISQDAILSANQRCFGTRFIPTYNFTKAETIVSFDADFLSDWLDPAHARQYTSNRKPENGKMSRHYHFESLLSVTGSNADKRVPIKPSEMYRYVLSLYYYLTRPQYKGELTNHESLIKQIADELLSNKKKSLVVSGIDNIDLQVIINQINHFLQNYDYTISTSVRSNVFSSKNSDINSCISDMNSGNVGVLMFLNTNPVYTLEDSEVFSSALEQVDTTISFSESLDETSVLCDFVCPTHNYLESWGDLQPYSTFYSLQQPTISPLFNTRQFGDSLLTWMGQSMTYYAFLKNFFKSTISKDWNKSLHDGFVLLDSDKKLTFSKSDFTRELDALSKVIKSGNNEIKLYIKQSLGNGHFSSNPWLQELPDIISKVTWDNYITMSPSHAKELGIRNWQVSNGGMDGDIVKIKIKDRTLLCPVYIQPGQAHGVLGLAFGYGRTHVGKAGRGVGVNAFKLYAEFNKSPNFKVQIEKTSDTHQFACTQNSHTMMGRNIVKETNFADYLKNPKSGNKQFLLHTHKGDQKPSDISLWKEHERDVHFWNMSIDLNSCTGCGACVIACHAENNVPVVGKEEVRKNRDMHWLRIDRYYSSDMTKDIAKKQDIGAVEMYKKMEVPSESENLEVVFQPVMCQHCNHAPCETVCPVAATTHSREGLNHMTYNRCIGTRYCMNNCPYKVRRFNWFNYSENNQFDYNMNDDLGKMVLNPDVTVRSRGVMEKCTMCIQNIQKTKLDAKKERRKIKDGEIKCACEKACDTGAIVFGDSLDKNSRVSKEKENPRSYYLIEELNTQPSVFYKTKVRNKKV